MDKEKRNKIIAIIILVIAIIVVIVLNIIYGNKSKEEVIDTKTISIVKDNDDFFTVSSCVSKYLNYLSINDTESLLTLLSKNYKEENNITSNNIYSYIKDVYSNPNFSPNKMYVQRLGKTIYKYYVYGTIEQEVINEISEGIDYYIIVILDESNTTFAIEPYNGEIFMRR